ncbi:MAG TPA: hypothetical protein PK659_10310 [Methanothrix sp.]|nr:hypothetical protein [Methanothrix sp.]HOL44635.1 hypothetical protein [Methanothrix sp.]
MADDRISVKGSILRIEEYDCAYGRVATQDIDLMPFRGQVVRVFLDNNLRLVVNPQYDCIWQIAEVYLPPAQVSQREKGIVQENVDEEIWITRGEGDVDEIDNLEAGEIIKAGFWWCNYQNNIDFQREKDGIRWLGERKPKEGEQYPVIIRRPVEVIAYESIVEPLDLSKLDIVFFDLPEEVQS